MVEDERADDAGADAEASETVDETLDFVVTLDRTPSRDWEATVDYRTKDGTAKAGSDYTLTSGTLTFAPGEDEKTVSVPIADDMVEDSGETLTLVLSNASAAGFASFGREALGTIWNTETAATGTPTISGTAQVGETLTADTSGISDADGLDDAVFGYQWLADGTDITGATGSTYILTNADDGKAVKVRVTFTDDGGNHESVISLQTTAVSAVPSTTTPAESRNLELTPVAVGTNGVGIKVSWDAPSATGDSDVSGCRIEWKGRNQDYPDDQTTRQAFVENAPYTIDTTSQTPIEGDELTVRVAAVNGAGASIWSDKTGWLPSQTDLELWLLMKEYAEEKQTTFPWVFETWNYLDENEVPVVVEGDNAGNEALVPCPAIFDKYKSLSHKAENSSMLSFWIPAFAGMTAYFAVFHTLSGWS